MRHRKKLVYHALLAGLCMVATALNTGLLDGTFAPYRLLYYTVANLLLTLAYSLACLVLTAQGKSFAPRFGGAAVMSNLLTAGVYYSALGGIPFGYSGRAMAGNLLAHLIVPAMALAGWLWFGTGSLRLREPLLWLAVPAGYHTAILALARLGLRYYGGAVFPYPFLDPARVGQGAVLANVAGITALYLATGYLLVGVCHALARWRGRQKAGAETSAPAG